MVMAVATPVRAIARAPPSRPRGRGRDRLPAAIRRPRHDNASSRSPRRSSARRTSLRASDSANCGRELTSDDPMQLGFLPGRHERVALESVDTTWSVSRPRPRASATEAATASAAKASQVLATSLSRVPAPDVADPDRALPERVEERGDSRSRLVGPRREDRQLAVLRRDPCSPTRVRRARSRRDALPPPGRRRARSPPRRSCSSARESRPGGERREHTLVAERRR